MFHWRMSVDATSRTKVIGTFLNRAAALLARFAFRCQRAGDSEEIAPAEKVALLAALNSAYRVYFRDESGRMRGVGVERATDRRNEPDACRPTIRLPAGLLRKRIAAESGLNVKLQAACSAPAVSATSTCDYVKFKFHIRK